MKTGDRVSEKNCIYCKHLYFVVPYATNTILGAHKPKCSKDGGVSIMCTGMGGCITPPAIDAKGVVINNKYLLHNSTAEKCVHYDDGSNSQDNVTDDTKVLELALGMACDELRQWESEYPGHDMNPERAFYSGGAMLYYMGKAKAELKEHNGTA